MPEAKPQAAERQEDDRVRLHLLAISGVLMLVVLGCFYLLVPTDWLGFPALLFWVAPGALIAVATALAAAQYLHERIDSLQGELAHQRDITAQREQERDLAQEEVVRRLREERTLAQEKMQFDMQLAAYEKYAALAQLALGAAHEINNPLLGILQHLELELKDTEDAERREEIEQCIQGTKRISSTVRGLINYARPGPLQLSRIHIGRLVDDALAFLKHQPMFRKIRLEAEISADTPAITADSNQLSQILMNLLLNAAEATPEGGRVSVKVHKIKFADCVEMAVSDTGCGIPADILPHVLEPFFTTKRGKGTGLGLSISHAYVRSHAGDLRVESAPGQGTTVRMILPIRQEGRMVKEEEEEIVV